MIHLSVQSQYIFCDTHPKKAITTNGHHYAVQVGNLVFDNHHIGGLAFAKWSTLFAAPGTRLGSLEGFEIREETFAEFKQEYTRLRELD